MGVGCRGSLAGLIVINAMQVGNLTAEIHYWFAIIKVVAIVAFILVGLGLIFGFSPVRAVGFSNLTAHGGFFPYMECEGRLAGYRLHAYELHGCGDPWRHRWRKRHNLKQPSLAPCAPYLFGSFFSTSSR